MRPFCVLATVLLAAACSQPAESPVAPEPDATVAAETPAPGPAQSAGVAALAASGLGPYMVGQPIALGGPAPPREADRISEDCRLFSDPDLPGVWVMTDGAGVVQRVSVGPPSTAETARGIGVGASEAALRAAYPDLRREPHEYAVGGDNLYAGAVGEPDLRFELGSDRRVSEMHGGAPPFLAYSEGCA